MLLPSGEGDEPEGSRHQRVPFPPGEVPVSSGGDCDHCLCEQGERAGDRDQDAVGAFLPVEVQVPNRGEAVERDSADRKQDQAAACVLRRQRAVQRGYLGERDGCPGGNDDQQGVSNQQATSHDGIAVSLEVQSRSGGKASGDEQPNRRCDHKAGVPALEQHAGSRQRVEAEERGARDERHRHEEEASVTEATRRFACQQPERDVDDCDRGDEPEVRRMVLPAAVQVRLCEQHDEPGNRDGQRSEPEGQIRPTLTRRINGIRVEPPGMARRWLPLGLALLAAALDASGSHGLAFHALLIAVPAAAVGALGAFGELLDLRADDRAETPLYLLPVLSAMGLVLLVVTAAVRAPTIADAATPAMATNLLSLGLGLLCLEALLSVFFEPRPARVRVVTSSPRPLLDR